MAKDFVHSLVHRNPPGQATVDTACRGGTGRLPKVTEKLAGSDYLVALSGVGGDQQTGDHSRE